MTRADFQAKQTVLQRTHFPSAQPLPGVSALLQNLSTRKIHLALATSSHAVNFGLKTSHLNPLFENFAPSNRVLGDDPRIPKGKGKPAPDIYLVALETINAEIRAKGWEKEIKPEECLVFEDSVPGVEAGRRAGMRVVWCPHAELLKVYRGREKEVLAGLTGLQQDREVAGVLAEAGTDDRVKGRPGKTDDGWAELMKSLVDFPYRKYGIDA